MCIEFKVGEGGYVVDVVVVVEEGVFVGCCVDVVDVGIWIVDL